MFILERLIGVGIYALLLLLVCLSLVGKSHKKIKRILFLYTVTLSILAFFYVPYETADLYRIYEYIDSFSKLSFSELCDTHLKNPNIGLIGVVYWGLGKLGIPQLLPVFVTFISFRCIFYIVNACAQENKITGKNVALTVAFYMSLGTYMFTVGGSRCFLGIALFSFCFYRENVEAKFNLLHVPLYVIAAMLHTFSAVLIALRFLVSVLDFRTTALRKILYLLLLGGGTIVVVRYFGEYLAQIEEKAQGYLEGNIYSYIWGYVIDIFAVFGILLILLECRKLPKIAIQKCKGWMLYLTFCLIVAVAFCYEYSIFTRTILHISPIICLPLLMVTLQVSDDKKRMNISPILSFLDIRFTYKTVICTLSLLLLLLSCARGDICSLKFFVL